MEHNTPCSEVRSQGSVGRVAVDRAAVGSRCANGLRDESAYLGKTRPVSDRGSKTADRPTGDRLTENRPTADRLANLLRRERQRILARRTR